MGYRPRWRQINVLNVGLDLADMLVSALRLDFERAQDHFIEPHINLHFFGGKLKTADRHLAGKHFIKDYAQRIDIRAMIDVERVFSLLGCHVDRRPERLPGKREMRVQVFGADDFREAKIRDFHPALFIEKDVARLDVTMNHAFIMRELQRVTDLGHDRERPRRRKRFRFDHPFQIGPVDEFHHEVAQPLGLAEIVHGNDVRMIERSKSLRLPKKARGEPVVFPKRRRKNLYRDHAIELFMPRLVDFAHSATPEELNQFKLRESGIQLDELLLLECFFVACQQARWAKLTGRVQGDRCLALRAEFGIRHTVVGSPFTSRIMNESYRPARRISRRASENTRKLPGVPRLRCASNPGTDGGVPASGDCFCDPVTGLSFENLEEPSDFILHVFRRINRLRDFVAKPLGVTAAQTIHRDFYRSFPHPELRRNLRI